MNTNVNGKREQVPRTETFPAVGDCSGETSAADTQADLNADPTKAAVDALLFDALRNAIYHSLRADHFAKLHQLTIGLIIFCGTAGAATLASASLGSQPWSVLTALLGTIDLVFDFKTKATIHSKLKQDYYSLLATIDETPVTSAANIRKWKSRLVRITADEPKTYRALDAVAYNNALDALGRDADHRLMFSPTVGFLCQWVDYKSFRFLTSAEHTNQNKQPNKAA